MFKVGDLITWTMQDNNVMSGTVIEVWRDMYGVRRVDGSSVTVEARDARQATPEDLEAACNFFLNIGKVK